LYIIYKRFQREISGENGYDGEIERTGKEEPVILKIYIGIQLGTRLRLNLAPSEYSSCIAVDLTL
jgi:hypothetical protein